ncbi:hypothetical protein SAMN05216327_10775 [Dyadobacter sp. SG02]|uniref:hypothetical protein n=1 Tax=Dyadobacter sp. SG02 TaxID=1855291 RepID=UPI0008C4B8D8|nr:hypothetical protein [Dyadobacter sp. SG02]SEJ20483.1 hypothetical protein SAMN05216327_10775 [Dyadobacter sp. SG02]
MKLTLSKTVASPLNVHLQLAYPLESRGAFMLGDQWRILLLYPDGTSELIWQTTDEDIACKWRGLYDDRPADAIFDEIRQLPNGFQLLSKELYQRIETSDFYQSARTNPIVFQGHDQTILSFAGKKISILTLEENVRERVTIKTKGRDLICQALHTHQNLIIYGTNHGELFAQPFDQDQFGKTVKIDQLPNTCYQITFAGDGQKMFVGGLGYVKVFDYDGKIFTETASISSALRSFALVEDHLVLNKGMHGIDVIKVGDKLQRVSSLDLPFAIDKMFYLARQKTFLLTSSATNEWALLDWSE